ncbi:MAG: response regulator [Calothrix sp. SM1_5_4]|nr:response regulator [Calothrix sp. SM1_5_4]
MIRVLIVDDSKAVHAYLATCFKGTNVQVVDVFNGREALDLLAKEGGRFDLILLDWEMPVCDGPTTFAELKSGGSAIPVLMMTTKNDPEDISRMLSAGVNEYMLKPFTKDVLFEKIEYVMGRPVANAA